MFTLHRCGYVFWQLFSIVDSVLYCQENTYQGSVWFCLCVYLLHLQDRTTRMRYLCFVPSLQWTVTFLLRTSSATQRHSLLWRLIILENSGNQGSSSIGKHSPSQIVSLIGLRLVQKPFDTYLRIRIPWHPRLRMPDVFFGCSNSKLLSSGAVVGAIVVLVATRGVDSVDASFCSVSSAFWRARLPSQHMQTRAKKTKFRCQHDVNRLIMCPEYSCRGKRLGETVLSFETKLSVCSGWLLNNWEASYKCQ